MSAFRHAVFVCGLVSALSNLGEDERDAAGDVVARVYVGGNVYQGCRICDAAGTNNQMSSGLVDVAQHDSQTIADSVHVLSWRMVRGERIVMPINYGDRTFVQNRVHWTCVVAPDANGNESPPRRSR